MQKYPALTKAVAYLLERGHDIHPLILAVAPDLEPYYTKTYEFFLRTMQRLIRSVYEGNLAGEFVDIVQNLIAGQLRRAYEEAWKDEGFDGALPDYLAQSLSGVITSQQAFVQGLYNDIRKAKDEETSLDALLSRAPLWAGQYDASYREAVRLIRMDSGGNFVWRKGATENGCSTCDRLNGIVMSAREWQELDLHPRGYPNPLLECEGGGPANNCDCELEPTDKRRTPKGYNTVLNIISR